MWGIDTSSNVEYEVSCLKNQKVDYGGNVMSKSEAQALSKDFKLMAVWENAQKGNDPNYFSYSHGVSDGEQAFEIPPKEN